MKNKNVPRKPSKIFVTIAYILLWPYLKIRYNVKVYNKKILKQINKPYVVICNHASTIDPFLITGAFFPYLINFVGGYAYFKHPILKIFLKWMGAIPKFVYQNDLNSIKQMISVTRNNHILGLFPAGRLPSCGEGFPVFESLGKLLKKCDAAVVIGKIDGAYLSKPKWSKTNRRGKINITIKKLLTAEEVRVKTIEELNETFNKELSFNDYFWQEKQEIAFKGRRLAEGLEKILYRCPKCGKEFSIKTSKNIIMCKKCKFRVILNKKGFFEENDYFKNPYYWFEHQKYQIQTLLVDKTISLKSKTKLKSIRNNKLVIIGEGVVELNFESITFCGTIDGIKEKITIKTDDLISLPYRAGENFELSYNNNTLQFYLENGLEVVKWSIAIEEIYKKKHDGTNP